MKTCPTCGTQMEDYVAQCPNCGAILDPAKADKGSIGWSVLGFLFPIVGIIMYFVWKDQKPATAKGMITAAAISIGINVLTMVAGSGGRTALIGMLSGGPLTSLAGALLG